MIFRIIALAFLASSLMAAPSLEGTAQLVGQGLDHFRKVGEQGLYCGMTINTVDPLTSPRFIYDENSTCGGYGGNMLASLGLIGQSLDDKSKNAHKDALKGPFTPHWELKLVDSQKTTFIPPGMKKPNGGINSTSSFQANVFSPIKTITCIPHSPEKCAKDFSSYPKYKYVDPINKSESIVCGGIISYQLVDGDKTVQENWDAGAFIRKCQDMLPIQQAGADLVSSEKAEYAIGICSFYQQMTSASVKVFASKERFAVDGTPLDYCFVGAKFGGERECTGDFSPVKKKDIPVEVPPPVIACPEGQQRNAISNLCECIDKEKKLVDGKCLYECKDGQFVANKDDCPKPPPVTESSSSCCTGWNGQNYNSLCTTRGVAGVSDPTFHIVQCIGKGVVGSTLSVLSCSARPAYDECCETGNYSNYTIVNKCRGYLGY